MTLEKLEQRLTLIRLALLALALIFLFALDLTVLAVTTATFALSLRFLMLAPTTRRWLQRFVDEPDKQDSD
ncbi:MAG: hypothetical protein AAFQ09_08035 [Pseudomonadota bacterium]